jgi:hypothetical protein
MVSFTYAQKNIETQQLVWLRYALKLKLSDNYQIRQELEERSYWFPFRQHQLVSRTLLDRKLGKGWNAATGFAYFRQSLPQDPDAEVLTTLTELRPQLELAYAQPLSERVILHHRYWSEFRFFEQDDGNFNYGNNRTRYKLELRYSMSADFSLIAFDEVHFNIGREILNNVFDQNRYGASVQYMHGNFGLELGYINWFQQRASGTDFYQRHIIRLTLHHSISIQKRKPS